ncbi:pentapeptide repeat-containing protein [Chlorogloeopsis sp. ULAP01]|uniref:pentapeptide repeat-containing protein n=1 Tax=Chlorogloeopsis sp. ULAP01 TaxID=3056483 RepID=UPI003390416D
MDVDFSRVNLQECLLQVAYLVNASFSYANLEGTGFSASLINCNLSNTNLREASFRYADLTGTNLTGADLRETKLIGCNLRDANLLVLEPRKGLFSATLLCHMEELKPTLPKFLMPRSCSSVMLMGKEISEILSCIELT